ncbi:MAG: hypothetical protein ACOX41_08780 [Anaerovoracaceae bacterium]|jgi:hypothetical protein
MSSQNGKHRAHRALQELLRAVFFVNDADETYDECGDRRENTQPDQKDREPDDSPGRNGREPADDEDPPQLFS